MRHRHFTSFLVVSWFAFVAGVGAADGPATFKVSEFTFARPAGWEWVESASPMRKAQLKVPDAGKAIGAEVVFFHFGAGQGGDSKANIDRWLGQFKEPRDQIKPTIEDVKIGQRKVSYVRAEGTYLSGPPAGAKTPQPGSMLLGAIIESDEGNVFVKLTGPAALVKSSADDFKKMIAGALQGK